MPMAFVLLNVDIGNEDEVLKAVKKFKEVEEIHKVYGVYDLVAKIRADTMDKLKDIVTWDVRRVTNVKSTLTMIVIEDSENT